MLSGIRNDSNGFDPDNNNKVKGNFVNLCFWEI